MAAYGEGAYGQGDYGVGGAAGSISLAAAAGGGATTEGDLLVLTPLSGAVTATASIIGALTTSNHGLLSASADGASTARAALSLPTLRLAATANARAVISPKLTVDLAPGGGGTTPPPAPVATAPIGMNRAFAKRW